jgi:uncharacterized protein YgiM (DUF1202 family)
MSNESNKPENWWKALLENIKTNTKVRYGVIGGALALVLIILIILCVSCSNNKEVTDEDVQQGVSDDEAVQQGTLEPTTNEAVEQLVLTYYQALETGDSATVESVKSDVTEEEKIKLEAKAADIESIDNITVYTRPGLTDDSYVVLIYSEMKFVGIDTKAPGLASTYVSTNADGNLYIESNVDETTMEYIKQVVAEDEIADYFNQVSADYTNAITQDENLANYMNGLEAKLDAAVAERQAAAEQEAEAATEQVEETAQEETNAQTTETVVTTSKVNVRVSDSENADRLGQVESGISLTRYEAKENGWSKIDYNGQEGYIKSEYLQVSGTDTANETEQTDESAAVEETTTTTGKVTAKESVRVRASASASGEQLGMLYQGESCDLIMKQADGWCKISYNGKTGYVKTDYVDVSE